MSALYLDASALLRVLFDEPGSRVPLLRDAIAVSSRLVEVEAFRAIDRARLGGYLEDVEVARKSKELYGLLERLHLAPISDEVIDLSRAPFSVNVRALDAIHVATAELLSEEMGLVEFWTHDARQATAALSRGLDVRGLPTK
jgi:predicted nucleic acid-binding protein